MSPRERARVDGNQAHIVKQLRDLGCSVLHLHTVGKGCGDILVGWRNHNWLFELKDGSQAPSRRKLTPAEEKFRDEWRGQYAVCKNLDEVLDVLGVRL